MVAACGLVAGAELPITVYPFILRGVTLAGIDSAKCPRPQRIEMWQRLADDWRIDQFDDLANEATLAASGDRGSAVGSFVVLSGPDLGEQFLVSHTGIIGRERGSAIVLKDPRVSSRHGYLHVEGGRVTYSDLETSNGSYLAIGRSRRRLRGPHVLSDGDEITVGYTVLRYMQFRKGGSR